MASTTITPTITPTITRMDPPSVGDIWGSALPGNASTWCSECGG
jgi:hypothetical protein